jgi:5-methylcytosine-specific restriction endonuclease McrA
MRKYRCSFPGCHILQDSPGFCEYHIKYKKEVKPYQKAIRFNQELYHTARWKELRKYKLSINPSCQICGSTERLEVHHNVPPKGSEELFFDVNNLTVLCNKCHRMVTNAEVYNERQRK